MLGDFSPFFFCGVNPTVRFFLLSIQPIYSNSTTFLGEGEGFDESSARCECHHGGRDMN